MNLPRTLLTILAAGVLAGPAHGQAPDPAIAAAQSAAYRNSVAQDGLRNSTQHVRRDMAQELESFQQLPAAETERGQLQDALDKLGAVGGQDMAAVEAKLREASGETSLPALQDRLVRASRDQKGIQTSLQVLSDRLISQQSQAAMLGRLERIVERQTANLRRVTEATRIAEVHRSKDVFAAEQSALESEIKLVLDALRQTLADPGAKDTGGFAKALKAGEDGAMAAEAAAAAEAIAAGKLGEGVVSQQRVLAAAQAMLLSIAEAQALADRLREMASRVREVGSAQKALAASTLRADPATGRDLFGAQQGLTDHAAALDMAVTALNADAAGQLRVAEDTMTSASEALRHRDALKDARPPGKPDAANPRAGREAISHEQDDAAGKLAAIADALENQAAALENGEGAPATADAALTSLQQLGEQVAQAMDQQTAALAAKTPDAAREQQLAAAAAAMQQSARSVAPLAAAPLGVAAADLQAAAAPAGDAKTAKAAAAESAQAAAGNLAQAQAAIQRAMQAMAQAAAAQQQLAALIAELLAVKNKAAEADTFMQRTPTGGLTDAVIATQAAEGLLEQARALAVSDGAVVPAEANQHMQAAQPLLAQSRLLAAQPQRDKAMANNSQAQGEIDLALALLKQAQAEALAAASGEGAGQGAGAQAAGRGPGQGKGPGKGKGQGKGPAGGGQGKGLGQNGFTGGSLPSGKDGPPSNSGSPGGPHGDGAIFVLNSELKGGPAQVVTGLTPRERAAVLQLEKEAPPAEYEGMVRQYTRNLANGDSPEREQP